MITTVIFDLDGLLADTEPLHCQAYQKVLSAYGIYLSEMEYLEHWVRAGKGIAEWVTDHDYNVDPQKLRSQKASEYLTLVVESLRPIEGAIQVLDRMKDHKTLSLATSSYREAADAVLNRLGIAHYFAAVITGSEVTRAKPAPDIFLLAAHTVGASPMECVVVEDAEKGIVAASQAGMQSIAVPNRHTRHHDFSQATLICASLEEITLELLERLGPRF